MPIREYACDKGHVFEVLTRHSDSEEIPQCSFCTSTKVTLRPSRFYSRMEAIHPSERPIVLKNDKGEIRYIADRDAPVSPKYAAQGYRKVEAFTTFAERDNFEKSTGRIHERSHYDPGSATAEQDLAPPDPQRNLDKLIRNHPRT